LVQRHFQMNSCLNGLSQFCWLQTWG